jgi:hypothetical protein
MRGQLGYVSVIHWEQMRWFPRAITPTDIDGLAVSATYWFEAANNFMFFEFKHHLAPETKDSGQARAVRALVTRRLLAADRVVWVWHNAGRMDGEVHVVPESIVRWAAWHGGAPIVAAGKGEGAATLEAFCRAWGSESPPTAETGLT